MKEQVKNMIVGVKAELDDLDEQELQARIEMNDAHKNWESVRVQRELKIQRLRILIDMATED